MRESKFQIVLGGIGAAVLLPGAFVAAALLLRDGAGLGTVILALVLAIVLLAGALTSGTIAVRAYVRRVLQTMSNRLERAFITAEKLADRRQNDLITEHHRTHAVADAEIRPRVEGVSAKLAEVDQRQRDVQSYLKKEANAQEVLDKLLVVERRVVSGIESGALTTTEEFTTAINGLRARTDAALADLRQELAAIRMGSDTAESVMTARLSRLDESVSTVHSALGSAVPRAEQASERLDATVGSVVASVDGLDAQIKAALGEIGDLIESMDSSLSNSIGQARLQIGSNGHAIESLGSALQSSASQAGVRLDEVSQQIETLAEAVEGTAPLLERHTDSILNSMKPLRSAGEDSASQFSTGFGILDSRLSGLDSAIEDMKSSLAPGVDDLASRLDALGEALEALGEGVNGLGPDFERRVKGLDGTIASLHTKLDESGPSLEDKISTIDSKMNELQALAASSAETHANPAPDAAVNLSANGVGRVDETLQTVLHLTDTAKNEVKALSRHVDKAGIETVRQVESLLQLLPRVDTSSQRFPQSGGFAMNPDGLLLLSDLIMRSRPRRIVELGSGTSTVWMATFARAIGAELISIDHLEEYRDKTAQMLEDAGLSEVVDLRLAPLSTLEISGEERSWYELAAFDAIEGIDMVIVDGPPESTGPEPRFPAFPILRDKLESGALVVIDDFQREQEAKMVDDWMAEDPRLAMTRWGVGRTGVLQFVTDQ